MQKVTEVPHERLCQLRRKSVTAVKIRHLLPGSTAHVLVNGAMPVALRPAWLPVLLALALVPARAASAASDPSETVRRYLGALKSGDFDAAYDLVSAAMRQGKAREAWVKEQRTLMAFADVKIFGFDVQPATIEGEVARVPNVLSSQDRLVNQIGLTEYELYTLVKESGAWKVDSQLLVEPRDLPRWFPKLSPQGRAGGSTGEASH